MDALISYDLLGTRPNPAAGCVYWIIYLESRSEQEDAFSSGQSARSTEIQERPLGSMRRSPFRAHDAGAAWQ
ncbi:hypothetical protein IAQ61_011906 [Plenodomus lingam]|uniref:uncharacterized protein n=1 Tax=Leptosphaeria maculans TaxID=5022 RepID=UPI0033201999|nr:hypothetical protein IAQ61_011906 [Plenodomus lingam]